MNQQINWRGIFYINGCLLLALALTMMIPLFLEIFSNESGHGFLIGFFVCFVIGGVFFLGNRSPNKMTLGMREAFLVTSIVWIVLSLFSAIPFYFSLANLSFIDACFESISAITTTGTTILKKIEELPKTILLWRSILQWFGGIGIIVIAMSFFPALRLGGMQLFRSEFSDRYEKILPKVSQISLSLLICYSFLTIICAAAYNAFGMNTFDSLCHAMCTISTGGLSNYSNSLAHFNSYGIECVACIFMIIGSTTLMLFVRMLYGDWKSLFKDAQFLAFMKVILISFIFTTSWLWFIEDYPFVQTMRYSLFHIISATSTTGYVFSDITMPWPPAINMTMFVLGCVGGCTGSTTGGIKIFRIQVLFQVAVSHLRQLRRPNVVLIPKFQGQKITDAIAFSVFSMIVLYLVTLVVLTMLLSAFGFDFLKGFYSAASVLANLGTAIIPLLEQNILSDPAKIILMLGMICGRLEFLTVLILLMPSFWKN
ncbi:MAG: Trk system potassium uptake protein TrkH [Holosporales bacterium]